MRRRVSASSAANGSSISSTLRPHRQRARNRHALLHAAGQRVRIGIGEVAPAPPCSGSAAPPRQPRRRPCRARAPQREHHVLLHRLPRRQLVEFLEHDDAVRPWAVHALPFQRGSRLSAGVHEAGRRPSAARTCRSRTGPAARSGRRRARRSSRGAWRAPRARSLRYSSETPSTCNSGRTVTRRAPARNHASQMRASVQRFQHLMLSSLGRGRVLEEVVLRRRLRLVLDRPHAVHELGQREGVLRRDLELHLRVRRILTSSARSILALFTRI